MILTTDYRSVAANSL